MASGELKTTLVPIFTIFMTNIKIEISKCKTTILGVVASGGLPTKLGASRDLGKASSCPGRLQTLAKDTKEIAKENMVFKILKMFTIYPFHAFINHLGPSSICHLDYDIIVIHITSQS